MSENLPTNIAAPSLAPAHDQSRHEATRDVFLGAILGLAWAASLRAWMTTLALHLGDQPSLTWLGTFVGILLPAALMGALVGRAFYVAKTSDRERWRWVILSPLLLVLGPAVVQRGFLSTLLATGMGGGAIGVALVGILGGFAFSGFGRKWIRWISGIFAVLFAFASVAPAYLAGSSSALPSDAGEVFEATLFLILMGLLVAGISAPSRTRARRTLAA